MPKPRLYEAHGRWQTLSEWAKESGHTYSMLASRLAWGNTLEEALAKPKRSSGYEVYTLNGEQALLKQWATRYNVDYRTLRHRIKTMPLAEALGISDPIG